MIGLMPRRAITALFMAFAALTAASAQAGPLLDSVPSITVEGEARQDVVPDLAVITLGVVSDRATAPQAAADNARTAATLVATARGAGLNDADIKTSAIELAAITSQRDASNIKTFRASNQITLRVHDLTKVGALVGQLAAQGANDVGGISFEVENPQPILDDLRGKATQDASRKAGIYARAANVKLGRILRIAPDLVNAATPMPRAYRLQAAASAPAPPVEAGVEALESRVQITWELVP